MHQNMFASNLFADRVLVITGGGTGIGYATAAWALALGGYVSIWGRRCAVLDAAVARLGHARVSREVCDIREPEQVAAATQGVLTRHNRIDVLVNNAGGQFAAPAEAISPNGFTAVVRNNLLGTFNVTREVALRAMLQGHGGAIVNVIANVKRGFPGMAHTGAARAGVENLTRSLAVEWASRNVRVNAVAPGYIRTEGTEQYPSELWEMTRRATPLKRHGTPEEVAAAILYLASPMAAYITGTTLTIDGGAQLWGDVWPIADP